MFLAVEQHYEEYKPPVWLTEKVATKQESFNLSRFSAILPLCRVPAA